MTTPESALRALIDAIEQHHATNSCDSGTLHETARLALATLDPLDETEETRRGQLLVDVLGLKRRGNGRYMTTWGDKTALGLYRTVKRIIAEGE